MSTTQSASLTSSDDGLLWILKFDGVLTLMGASIGAVLAHRQGQIATLYMGGWVGMLTANLIVWTCVALIGFYHLITGQMPWNFVEVPLVAKGSEAGVGANTRAFANADLVLALEYVAASAAPEVTLEPAAEVTPEITLALSISELTLALEDVAAAASPETASEKTEIVSPQTIPAVAPAVVWEMIPGFDPGIDRVDTALAQLMVFEAQELKRQEAKKAKEAAKKNTELVS